jgi:3-dehydroquinate dehydratase-2
MKKVLVLHGPNLNLLGLREPNVYGADSLEALNETLTRQAESVSIQLRTLQSQAEHVLIEAIHKAYIDEINYIIINPAALTHTSLALRDALLAVNIPFIEVHLSNLFKRENYRQKSYISDIAQGVIQGFGINSYVLALEAVIRQLT